MLSIDLGSLFALFGAKSLNCRTFLKHFFSFVLGFKKRDKKTRQGAETINSLTQFIQLAKQDVFSYF